MRQGGECGISELGDIRRREGLFRLEEIEYICREKLRARQKKREKRKGGGTPPKIMDSL